MMHFRKSKQILDIYTYPIELKVIRINRHAY